MAGSEAYVIPPLTGAVTTITDAMLIASSVPETAPAVWSNVTTYALGDQRSITGAHNSFDVYISLQAANLNHAPASSPTWWRKQGTTYGVYAGGTTYATGDHVVDPTTHHEYESLVGSNMGNALTDETKWSDLGMDARWAALDLTASTGTTAPSPVTYTIEPGKRVDAFGFAGMVADSYTVTVTKDGDELYSYTESLSTRVVLSWSDWLTKPFTFRAASSRNDMPLMSGCRVTITFTRASGDVTIGSIFVNRSIPLGDVEVDPQDDAQNYSTFSRNIEGTASSFVPRRVIPLIRMTAFTDAARVPELRAARAQLRATPAFWVGLPDAANPYYESVQSVGVWKNFKITPSHPDARVDLDLEEA